MKTITRTQMRLVEAETPTELMVKFNQMLDDLARSKVSFKEPVISLETLTAYVIYTEQEVIAETRADEHSLKGENYHCSDCKHYHEYHDRGRGVDCPYRHGMTMNYDPVCKEFWDAYEFGEDILFVPRNKDGSVNRATSKGKRYLELKRKGVVR